MGIEARVERVRRLIHAAAGNRRAVFTLYGMEAGRRKQIGQLTVPADLVSGTEYVPGTEGYADKQILVVAALDLEEAVQNAILPRYPRNGDEITIQENLEAAETSTITKEFYDTLGASRASFGYVIGP